MEKTYTATEVKKILEFYASLAEFQANNMTMAGVERFDEIIKEN